MVYEYNTQASTSFDITLKLRPSRTSIDHRVGRGLGHSIALGAVTGMQDLYSCLA